jgi:hypothetical protein
VRSQESKNSVGKRYGRKPRRLGSGRNSHFYYIRELFHFAFASTLTSLSVFLHSYGSVTTSLNIARAESRRQFKHFVIVEHILDTP